MNGWTPRPIPLDYDALHGQPGCITISGSNYNPIRSFIAICAEPHEEDHVVFDRLDTISNTIGPSNAAAPAKPFQTNWVMWVATAGIRELSGTDTITPPADATGSASGLYPATVPTRLSVAFDDYGRRNIAIQKTETTTEVKWYMSNYDEWAAAYAGGQAKDLDFNSDGVSNGLAFFMGVTGTGTNPGVVGGVVTWPNGGNIRHTEYGTEFVVQYSSNFVTYVNVLVTDPNLVNNASAVKYTLPGPGSARIRITPAAAAEKVSFTGASPVLLYTGLGGTHGTNGEDVALYYLKPGNPRNLYLRRWSEDYAVEHVLHAGLPIELGSLIQAQATLGEVRLLGRDECGRDITFKTAAFALGDSEEVDHDISLFDGDYHNNVFSGVSSVSDDMDSWIEVIDGRYKRNVVHPSKLSDDVTQEIALYTGQYELASR